MKPAVPEPSPPPEGPAGGRPSLSSPRQRSRPRCSDAPVSLLHAEEWVHEPARTPRHQVQHAQPSVGSIAAHRPHTVAAVVSDLEPDIDADLDAYEESPVRRPELPQGRFLDRERSWLAFNERVLELAEDPTRPCWSGPTSSRSSPATWTSSSWSGSPA